MVSGERSTPKRAPVYHLTKSGRVMKSVYDERRSSDSCGALDEGDSQPRLMREQTKTCID